MLLIYYGNESSLFGNKNMEQTPTNTLKDKINSSSPFSGITVPILIVILSVVLVAGITKMLSNDKGYVSLVEELRDKTFGNRWVAAFELSKYLASSQIPMEDIPWLENQLLDIYANSEEDPRTRNFLVLAAGYLQGPKSLELIQLALKDSDKEVLFAAISSVGRLNVIPTNFSWEPILQIASGKVHSDDEVLQHTALIVLTHHQKTEVIPLLQNTLAHSDSKNLRDASAIALLYFNNYEGFALIKEMMLMNYEQPTETKPNASLNVEANKLNIVSAVKTLIVKNTQLNNEMIELLKTVEKNDQNIQVTTRVKEVLLMLKK